MYVVMELIQLDQVLPEVLAERAAQAVHWMRDVRAPDDLVLGPKGGGPTHHVVFKNSEAPQNYRSVKALEHYFNKVRPCRAPSAHANFFFPPGC